MDSGFKDNKVLVIGGGSGIDRAITLAFTREGVHLIRFTYGGLVNLKN